MNLPAKVDPAEIMETVLVKGDLSKLSSQERSDLYLTTCKSLGLNPLTRPFEYITLNGKLTLYALRACTDQLRKVNDVSIEVVSSVEKDGLFTVHVRATVPSSRVDEDFGVVSLPDTLKGEARANQILKAVTKAKRRVTLSISGLGFLDETEIEDIPEKAKKPFKEEMQSSVPDFADAKPAKQEAPAGNVSPEHKKPAGAPKIQSSEALLSVQDRARIAAGKGEGVFYPFYKALSPSEKGDCNAIGEELRELMANGR
jgi:hypothetical protein